MDFMWWKAEFAFVKTMSGPTSYGKPTNRYALYDSRTLLFSDRTTATSDDAVIVAGKQLSAAVKSTISRIGVYYHAWSCERVDWLVSELFDDSTAATHINNIIASFDERWQQLAALFMDYVPYTVDVKKQDKLVEEHVEDNDDVWTNVLCRIEKLHHNGVCIMLLEPTSPHTK